MASAAQLLRPRARRPRRRRPFSPLRALSPQLGVCPHDVRRLRRRLGLTPPDLQRRGDRVRRTRQRRAWAPGQDWRPRHRRAPARLSPPSHRSLRLVPALSAQHRPRGGSDRHPSRRRAVRAPARPVRERAGLLQDHSQPDGVLMATKIEPGKSYGFFTDTSICSGCKACEVACKEWNQLQGNEPKFLADSYDNTGQLDDQNWRHVKFIDDVPAQTVDAGNGKAWLMMSDVCKHCKHASCMDVCPTGAIIRTEFDTVFIQQDVCNGCRNCIAACPYSVIALNPKTGTAHKCTLCYDRLQGGLEPACATACPTQSIQFGLLGDRHTAADFRLASLHSQGVTQAQLYGRDDAVYGGLNAFCLLMDKPETYGLPSADNAQLPTRNDAGGYLAALVTGILGVIAGIVAFRRRGAS